MNFEFEIGETDNINKLTYNPELFPIIQLVIFSIHLLQLQIEITKTFQLSMNKEFAYFIKS